MQGSLQNIPLAREPSFVAEALFLMLSVGWQKHAGKKSIDPGFLWKPAEQIILWPTVLPHRARDRPARILDSPVPVLDCVSSCSVVLPHCLACHRLAAVALLVLEDEENAFWCLVHIVENLMPADYYSDTLITSQVSWHPHFCLYYSVVIYRKGLKTSSQLAVCLTSDSWHHLVVLSITVTKLFKKWGTARE